MKVLHVISSLDPKHGGPSEAVRMIIQNRPPGFVNHALSQDPPDSPFIAQLPFPVHAVGRRAGEWYSPRLIPWLRAHRAEYDAVILHGLWGYTSVAVLAAVAGHVPYAVFPHGMLDPYFKKRYPLKHIKKWIFWVLIEYWVLRSAERVLFTAPLERDYAPGSFWLWRWKPMVVSYGADPPPIDPAAARRAFYERCPGTEGKRFLLYLGRMHRKKGCDMLLRAFAAVGDIGAAEETHLVMAGPDADNWRQQLMRGPGYSRIQHRVHWPGMLRGEAKWGAFLASEAFILPSHQENFGIAIAEALACARPVLISDKINIWQEIAEDGAGFVESDTDDGTLRLLQRWFALSDEERLKMNERAHHTFEDRYNMKKNTRRLFSLFDSTLMSPSGDKSPA